MNHPTIQVSLDPSVIACKATYKDDWGFERSMDGFKVDYSRGKRVYLVTIKDGIRLSTIAKTMQFANGNVLVKFGSKPVKIGTYQTE
ncbi:hypothetical protein LLE49_25110 [Alicyclobacillus tolerans]|uniref:hypothetical protein n=1 Tax=Alicyclobacillus tolerans TaxID=90970 RepID=UPI001F22F856|nr:hypothetical protein [Alicyclobacillus tolerans]MCF8568008.1 hypothetical protein [Alicyclobacillus tolerans]